jgi:hypothetical protein
MWGFLPVLIYRKNNVFFLSAAIIITSLVAFSLNTVQLYIWIGSGVFALLPLRLLIVILKWPVQIAVLKILKDRLSPLLQDA